MALRLSNVISLRAIVKQNIAANAELRFLGNSGAVPSDGGSRKMKSMSASHWKGQFSDMESGIGGKLVHRAPGHCGCLPSECMAWLDCSL